MKQQLSCITAFILVIAVNVMASGINDSHLKPLSAQNELVPKRGRIVKYYDRGQGLKTVVLSGSSSHYQDESGKWLEINTKIVGNTKGTWNYRSINNTIKAYWNTDQMAVADGDERILLELKGYGANNGKDIVKTARDKTARSLAKQNRLVFKDLFSNASEFYQVAPEQAYWESEGRMYKRGNT
ncbi:hypothetical protein HZA73_08960 [candidate division TA06 bacterium]|nr:hypothetical protein [candidate division TA06 bacterium]